MSLPKWNSAWDQPDPLKGRLGWARHHRVNLVVAVVLLSLVLAAMIPCVLAPALVRAKMQRDIIEKRNKELEQVIAAIEERIEREKESEDKP